MVELYVDRIYDFLVNENYTNPDNVMLLSDLMNPNYKGNNLKDLTGIFGGKFKLLGFLYDHPDRFGVTYIIRDRKSIPVGVYADLDYRGQAARAQEASAAQEQEQEPQRSPPQVPEEHWKYSLYPKWLNPGYPGPPPIMPRMPEPQPLPGSPVPSAPPRQDGGKKKTESKSKNAKKSKSKKCDNKNKKTQKKYTSRPSPAFPANECKNKTKKGNNGKFFKSVADKNGTYKWAPVVKKK